MTLTAVVLGGACSDKTNEKLSEAGQAVGDDARDAADQAAARSQAEALRIAIENDDRSKAQSVRSLVIVQAAVDKLPGGPTVTGLADADGDGLDDDGQFTVAVGARTACVRLPASGTAIEVSNGACP